MRVTEYIEQAKKTLVSYEILPPLKGRSIQSIFNILDPLMEFKPPFINVTYHREDYIYKKVDDDSFQKVVVRKRPGTVGICAAIMNRYKVDAVPHLICGGFTKDSTEDALIDLSFLGINNVLLLRGDAAKSEAVFTPEPKGNQYASDLVQQVVDMNTGVYLADDLKNAKPTDFCVGVAGYPEKHFEAPNMTSDIKYLKQKVDLGADYIVTQMFFDNQKFKEFVNTCRDAGITIPIIPGLKPLTTKRQVASIPRIFKVDIPDDLEKAIDKCKNDEDAREVGLEWCIAQSKDLTDFGVPCLHYYTMGDVAGMVKISGAVF